MNDDLFSRDFKTSRRVPDEHDNLFLWTVVILLLVGLAFACWLGSYYVFGHPEKPDSYRILQKLHKLEPPKRYEVTQAPAGEFLTPQRAYEKYATLSRFDLERENQAMLRDYINNFQATKRLVPYITGRYTIMSAYELKSSDFFGSGAVALTQSVDFPQTLVEHVYPAGERTLPVLGKMLATGLDIKMERTMDLSAIIRVTRLFDGRLQFTVVPLLYGSYALKDGTGSFSLEPPSILNPAAGLPIVRGQLLDDALKAYTEFTRKRMGARVSAGTTPTIPVAQPAAQTTIVRVDTAPTPSSSPTAGRAVAATRVVAKPSPRASAAPIASPRIASAHVHPSATPGLIAAASPSSVQPAVTPPSVESQVSPAPTPGAVVSGTLKVPLVPFLVSSPTPAIAALSGAAWRTYSPGRMPRGRLVTVGDVGDLADRGTGGERLYLRGNFVVTASDETKAVLRPSSGALASALASLRRRTDARVIVEFPFGMLPPSEGASVSRDEMRPFEVRDVRRGADGQLNVFVREVTAP